MALETTGSGISRAAEHKWDSDLAAYKAARDQGIQPASTQRESVDAAVELSNLVQQPFRADA